MAGIIPLVAVSCPGAGGSREPWPIAHVLLEGALPEISDKCVEFQMLHPTWGSVSHWFQLLGGSHEPRPGKQNAWWLESTLARLGVHIPPAGSDLV